MIEDIKHFRINWIDGMKISKQHFQDLQNYVQDVIKDTTSLFLRSNDYGLLPFHLNESFDYSAHIDTHKSLKISIKKLKAITPNGTRIDINPSTLSVNKEFESQELDPKKLKNGYILLNINPFGGIPFGEQDVNEVPPRHPFLCPDFHFSFAHKENILQSGVGPYQLPLLKVYTENENIIISSGYTPPCATIKSHPHLISFFDQTEAFVKRMERYAIQIVQKIKTREHDNPIADIMLVLSDKMLVFLGRQITSLKWEGYEMPPQKTLAFIVSLSRVMKNVIDTTTPENKEHLFNYFGEWTDVKGGDYENLFSEIINMPYSHFDIQLNLAIAGKFISFIDKLFSILNQLDYIGKRKDLGIFVNENILKDSSRPNNPSVLND